MKHKELTIIFSLIILLSGCLTKENETKNLQENRSEITSNSTPPKNWFAENNDSLTKILINTPPVDYCNEKHHHLVDIVVKHKIDSLINANIDTVLFYGHRISTNGYNGYGKLIYKNKGLVNQIQYNFDSHNHRYGISSIKKEFSKKNNALNFYFQNQIDTITSKPKNSEIWMSHDADHFIYTYIAGNENCFNVSGLRLDNDSEHLKSQLIKKLSIPSTEYYEMLKKERKKKL